MDRPRLAVGGLYLLLTDFRSESIAVNKKKKRGRPPTGIGPVIGVRLYPQMQAELAAWIERQPDPKPSRPEAIRRLIEKGLKVDRRAGE